jgi:hypothetical protein
VKSIIELAGIGAILLSSADGSESPPETERLPEASEEDERGVYERYTLHPSGSMHCRPGGDPTRLESLGFGDDGVTPLRFDESSLGVGLGAFGRDLAETRDRMGEFLAVGGAAIYLPTDGSNVPDYLVSAGTLVPEVNALYALSCEGSFAHLYRFESRKDSGPIPLSHLLARAHRWSGATTFAVAIVAETAGLFGVSLRRSPLAARPGGTPLAFPEVRRWLLYNDGLVASQGSAVVVGVLSSDPPSALAPFLRPAGAGLAGHLHAAALSYRPLKKGLIDLKKSVAGMVENESLQAVLHLLHDDRAEAERIGESAFTLGACWISPVVMKKEEGAAA